MSADPGRVLVTGATGYIGGRLRRVLEERGVPLRCLARHPERLARRVAPGTEVVAGDLLEPETLRPVLDGVHTAYYLVHSMGSAGDFEKQDRRAAENFSAAAREAGVRRIIYLGGLGNADGRELSAHLRSRQETGEVLRASGIPVVELRASIVIGSGSLSFEMIRALVERLPLMITPRWVEVKAQPIAIDDLLAYMVAILDQPPDEGRLYEIGGADRVSYGDLMREYARQRSLRRVMIRVPVLSPRLSSLWLGLVTPLYARVGRKLIESIRHPTLVHNNAAIRDFSIRPKGYREAIAAALANEDKELAETRWSDALSSAGAFPSWAGVRLRNRLVDSRMMFVPVGPSRAFAPIRRIGGDTGWYACNSLWRLRGFVDLLVGGVGVRRGRPHPETLHVGDALDFWRVEAFEPDHLLRLRAEMKVPGRAWLEFRVCGGEGGSTIRQIASFDPSGLLGLAYWYGIYPFHSLVFRRVLRKIAERALVEEERSSLAGTSVES